MSYHIAVIPGDGIGPEVIRETVRVLDCVSQKFGITLKYTEYLAGGCAIDAVGKPLPDETLEGALASDAVLLGAVGGEKWDTLPSDMRPENALLGLRAGLGLFANLRPAVLFDQLAAACPLKPELTAGGLDILVVRELTGGIYFGKKERSENYACDTMSYTEDEVRRIAHVAMKAAMGRNRKVTSVDKANILESSRLWRRVVTEVAAEYPEVTLSHMYVDNAAMQLVRNPKQFDVIVTENTFGDILTDEASMLTGSIGMLPSASIGGSVALYEPSHGSAPDIAGQNKANPLATILSAAMMLRYSFDLEAEAQAVEKAVSDVLAAGYRTPDLMEPGKQLVGTALMGDLVAERISKQP